MSESIGGCGKGTTDGIQRRLRLAHHRHRQCDYADRPDEPERGRGFQQDAHRAQRNKGLDVTAILLFALGILIGRAWAAVRNLGEAAHPNGDNHE